MSGSTEVSVKSGYFVVHMKSPCIRFPNPVSEKQYHDEKKLLFKKQLEIIKPRLDHFFTTLNNDPESKVNLIIFDKKLPEVLMEEQMDSSERINGPCRYLMYISPNVPIAGMMQIEIAFKELPSSKLVQSLKHQIEKVIKTISHSLLD
jgi:hypothetical protein